jgi:GTP pyrophosphokinase
MHRKLFFDATIELRGIDRMGMLLDVSKVISQQLDVNIHKITVSSDEGIFDGAIEIKIHDRDDVKIIIDNLKKIDGIQEIQRIM